MILKAICAGLIGVSSCAAMLAPQDSVQLRSHADEQDILIKGLNAEIVAVMEHSKLLENPVRLAEQIESVKRRYPNLIVSDVKTPSQLAARLKDYRIEALNEHESRLRILIMQLSKEQCDKWKKVQSLYHETTTSDEWLQMGLKERTEIRALMDAMMQDALAELPPERSDPCAPITMVDEPANIDAIIDNMTSVDGQMVP